MITADREEALAALARGERVVMIVAPDAPSFPAQPGRLALLVGDANDPTVTAAAAAMDRELHQAGG